MSPLLYLQGKPKIMPHSVPPVRMWRWWRCDNRSVVLTGCEPEVAGSRFLNGNKLDNKDGWMSDVWAAHPSQPVYLTSFLPYPAAKWQQPMGSHWLSHRVGRAHTIGEIHTFYSCKQKTKTWKSVSPENRGTPRRRHHIFVRELTLSVPWATYGTTL
jgi:hypothetical protein